MIIFSANVLSVVDDLASEDSSNSEDLVPEDSTVPEDPEAEVSSVSEDPKSEDSSVLDESSATGETQQSSTPTIINDIVVPDNSYSKYCFFFLMLLFALFVGRSFRKGV